MMTPICQEHLPGLRDQVVEAWAEGKGELAEETVVDNFFHFS